MKNFALVLAAMLVSASLYSMTVYSPHEPNPKPIRSIIAPWPPKA